MWKNKKIMTSGVSCCDLAQCAHRGRLNRQGAATESWIKRARVSAHTVGLIFATPVGEPSSACVLVVGPVGPLSAAYVSGSSVGSIRCAAGLALLAACLILCKNKNTDRKNKFSPTFNHTPSSCCCCADSCCVNSFA